MFFPLLCFIYAAIYSFSSQTSKTCTFSFRGLCNQSLINHQNIEILCIVWTWPLALVCGINCSLSVSASHHSMVFLWFCHEFDPSVCILCFSLLSQYWVGLEVKTALTVLWKTAQVAGRLLEMPGTKNWTKERSEGLQTEGVWFENTAVHSRGGGAYGMWYLIIKLLNLWKCVDLYVSTWLKLVWKHAQCWVSTTANFCQTLWI